MASISELPTNARADLTARLKRIEGQARGIQKMLEDGRDCSDVINQISAIKAATNALSVEALGALRSIASPRRPTRITPSRRFPRRSVPWFEQVASQRNDVP